MDTDAGGGVGVGCGDAAVGFEAGGTVPTLPVLGRIAWALGADLTVRVSPRSHVA